MLQIFAGGVSVEPLGPVFNFFTLAGARFELGSALREGYRVIPNLESGLLFNPAQSYKQRLRAVIVYDPLGKNRQRTFWELGWENSLSISRSLEVRTDLERVTGTGVNRASYNEAKLSLNYYF